MKKYLTLIIFAALAHLSHAQAPHHVWSKNFDPHFDNGSYFAGRPGSVSVDVSGNVYFSGRFLDSVDLGGGNLTLPGINFSAKFDASGNHVSSMVQDSVTRAIDGNSNKYVAALFTGTVNLGGGNLTSTGSKDIYIAKYDASGNHIWSKRFGGNNNSTISNARMWVDGNGNVYVWGNFNGTVDFGGSPLTSITGGGANIFFAKFNTSGNHVWSKHLHANLTTDRINFEFNGVDSSGNLYLWGSYEGTINLGGSDLNDTNGSGTTDDHFFVKYDASSGSHLWSKRWVASSTYLYYDMAVDGNGNVYFTGLHANQLPYENSIFLQKYNADGTMEWSQVFGSGNGYSERGYSVAVDGNGNVYITGYFYYTVDFGGGNSLTNVGSNGSNSSDMFLAKFDISGNCVWSQRYGGSGTAYVQPHCIAVDGSGNNIYVTGNFSGTVDFGGGNLTSRNAWGEYFLARYSVNATGIEDEEANNPIIYPNPATNTLSISLPNLTQPIPLVITNLLGEVVISETANAECKVIDVTALPGGMYFINRKKFIKQ